MKLQNKVKTVLTLVVVIGVVAVFSALLQAEVIIYEPFADAESSLKGNIPGTGLTGNWSASTNMKVSSGSLSYGNLPTSGNTAYNSTGRLAGATVSIGTELSDSGLLAHGAELWFSFLATGPVNVNAAYEFVLATDGNVVYNSGIPNSGSGIGVYLWRGGEAVQAATWDSVRTVDAPASTGARLDGETALVVGKITWGADGAAEDTISVYLPGTDLVLPASAVHTSAGVLDQSAFDVITFGGKNGASPTIDEIRFGGTYGDVTGVPSDPTTPVVEAGGDWIAWSGQGAQMAPVVANNDTKPLTYKWTTNAPVGYTVVFDPDDTSPAPIVTIDKDADTGNATVITVTLAVNNETRTRADVEDMLMIDLYDDACDAAVIGKGSQLDIGDITGDCITNIEDLAEMAMAWLVSYSITDPFVKP